jgi:phosphoglucosamine mutase
MGKLFGTDGIRGIANETLDCMLAYRVGLAASAVLAQEKHAKPLFVVGKDTRLSSDMLEAALSAGACAGGADVVQLGVIPTPAVAFLSVDMGADAGVVISASHNPYEYNGIKIFNGSGFKLSDAYEEKIERLVLAGEDIPVKTGGDIGHIRSMEDAAQRYINHVASTVGGLPRGRDLRVAVDCANGAASFTAKRTV